MLAKGGDKAYDSGPARLQAEIPPRLRLSCSEAGYRARRETPRNCGQQEADLRRGEVSNLFFGGIRRHLQALCQQRANPIVVYFAG
jgi:hypothetical protein